MRISDILGYADYALEVGVLVYILLKVVRRPGSGLFGVAAYLLASVAVGSARLAVAFHWGPQSRQYALCYWLTDYWIVFCAFLLVGSFFRRACLAKSVELWRHVRLMLASVFVLTGLVAYATILHHHQGFFPFFVLEFQQDLYFVLLVLITMLYLMLQRFEPADDQLGLLVSGLGIELAGFAACLALVYVAGGQALYGVVAGYVMPLCDIGMVLLWFYTAARVPKAVPAMEAQSPREVLPAHVLARI